MLASHIGGKSETSSCNSGFTSRETYGTTTIALSIDKISSRDGGCTVVNCCVSRIVGRVVNCDSRRNRSGEGV